MSLMQDQIEALQQAIAEAEKPKMRRATRKEKIVNPGVYKVPVHASDISQEPVDETEKDRHEDIYDIWVEQEIKEKNVPQS